MNQRSNHKTINCWFVAQYLINFLLHRQTIKQNCRCQIMYKNCICVKANNINLHTMCEKWYLSIYLRYAFFSRISIGGCLDVGRYFARTLLRYLPTIKVETMANTVSRLQNDCRCMDSQPHMERTDSRRISIKELTWR